MHGSNRVNQLMIENPFLRQRFDVRVLALNYARSIHDIGRFDIKKYVRLVKYMTCLFWQLVCSRPTAVYFVPCVTGGPFWRDCLFVMIFKIFRIRRIFHLHGKGIKPSISSNSLKRAVYRWFFKDVRVLLLSPYLYADIEDIISKGQVFYLANGTDVDCSDICYKGLSKKPIRFIFLSNLILTKGPETILEACRILKKKGYCFQTIFIGNPSKELTENKINALIQSKGLNDCVFFLGPKYGTDKDAELKRADVMVFPTYKDCFPLVLLEGMAFGLPVISTFEGAIPDIVDDGKTGFLIQPKDPDALAEKMELFIKNSELIDTLGRNGRKKYQRQYTLSSFNQRAVDIFSELV